MDNKEDRGNESVFDAEILGDQIVDALRTFYDPEIPVNVYDLGLIYDIEVNEKYQARILMTLTTPNCPVADSMPLRIQQTVLEKVAVLKDCEVKLTFDPPWDKDMMTEEAKFELGYM